LARVLLVKNSMADTSPETIKRQKAYAAAKRALERDSQNLEARYDLANLLRELRQYDDAIEAFRSVLEIEPNHIRALYNLGLLMLTKSRNDDARVLFRHVLAIDPAQGDAQYALGVALLELGEHAEAEVVYRELIALRPHRAEPLAGLAKVLMQIGDLGQARDCLVKAMTLAPDKPDILYHLVNTQRVQTGDPVIENLEALMPREASLSSSSREFLRFALAKAYDDIGERERGFRHLLEANAIRRQHIQYDEKRQLGDLEQIRQLFTPEMFSSARASGGDPSWVPIFVLGMPRSGSTLIEQILASHPQIFAAGERHEMMRTAERFLRLDTPATANDRATVMSPQLVRELGAHYVASMRRLAPEAQRIVDKLPQNFRFVGLIHLALPNARIIHSVRDPIDTCLSCFSNRSSLQNMQFSYDLGELGRFYRAYEQLMAHWRAVLPPGAMLEIQYESLVRNFEVVARQLIGYCDLEWDDACLAFHETRRPVSTLSFAQVRQPLYQTSVGRWRPDEELLRPLLEGLGSTHTE